MSLPSILVTTYHQAFLHKGGGEYELLEVAFNLRQFGFIADVYSPFSRDIDAYDVILHFSLVPESLPLIAKLKFMGKKIILWPNFWQSEELTTEQIKVFSQFFGLSEAIVFKSHAEEIILRSLIPDSCAILRVPASVDPCFATPTPNRLFRDSYDVEEYLLWVGIIEPAKNQLETIKALHHLTLPIIFVGNYRDTAYYNACVKSAPSHFRFLPPMIHKSDMLRAALRECRLYIESGYEPGGKSLLEAVISGAQVVIPRSPWAEEYFGDFPVYIATQSEPAIAEAVAIALTRDKNPCIADKVAASHMSPGVLTPLCDYIKADT